MPTSLEVKLQTAMQADTSIVSLLGTRADGRGAIYDTQLVQDSNLPAIVFLLVSAPAQYSNIYRMAFVRSRVQFTIWAKDPEVARSIEQALMSFLDSFNAVNSESTTLLRPNQVVNRRQSGEPQTDPLTYWRIVDAMIWNNEEI